MSSSEEIRLANDDGGYRHVLRLALPLLASTSSSTIMVFVDRMFLGWYDAKGTSLAAAMGGGFPVWMFTSLFLGTIGYTGTFVAQYYGARRPERVGIAVWQGVFLALVSWIAMAALALLAGPIIGAMKHDPQLMRAETIYFRILMFGSGIPAISAALSSFYSGVGRTRTIMAVETLGNIINAFFAYSLIFGRFGLPELGIRGAALAAICGWGFVALSYATLMRSSALGRSYSLLRHPRLDLGLMWRLIRYGAPSGLHVTLDIVGWTVFAALVGRLGQPQLEAVSITFTVNALAFLPMVGLGTATSVIMGQSLMAGRPDVAERATKRAFIITFLYMAAISVVFVLAPRPLIKLFSPSQESAEFIVVMGYAAVLLRFVALYSLFDGMNIIYAGAIKGAGDTRFVVLLALATCTGVLIVPSYLIIEVFKLGLYPAMAAATAYVIVIAIAFYIRYKGGKWRHMRVIEAPVPHAKGIGDGPTAAV